MAKCVVLGANGFIGSHLVDALVRSGHDVRAFDRFSSDPIFEMSDHIEVMRGDFLNLGDLTAALAGIEYVFHFISTTTPISAENDPLIDIETNIRMSVELFRLCVDSHVKKVIFASTGGAIYGQEHAAEPHKETDTPYPVSPYAIGKLSIEHYLRYFRKKFELDSIVLRISNPYGERQPFHSKQGVIPIFMERVYKDEPITVLGDGTMVRDYIYVKDVAQMIASIFDRDTHNHTYNLASGVGIDINELVKTVNQVSGKQAKIEHLPVPATFLPKVLLDTTRFREEFGLTSTTTLEDGMRATYEYIANKSDEN